MITTLKERLKEERILLYQVIPFSECIVTKPHLLRDVKTQAQSVLLFAIPYRTDESCARLSQYAQSYDYHLYFCDLFEKCISDLKAAYPQNWFVGFADHSPIDERDAAVKCGLGCLGDNRLLITAPYGTYVFLGEIISDLSSKERNDDLPPIPYCIHCKKCIVACPSPTNCLSAITQKKQPLTQEEIDCMRKCNTAWGCDICQEVCPCNNYIEPTPIPFFQQNRLKTFSKESILQMSDEEFSMRAFSWRGKECVLRNLDLLEE